MTENSVRSEVAAASQQWVDHFNAKNVQACVDTYLDNAAMTATPLGHFEGHEAIAEFWHSLVADGYTDLVYRQVDVKVLGMNIALLSAQWSMNLASGYISQELWIKSPQGRWQLGNDEFAITDPTQGESTLD